MKKDWEMIDDRTDGEWTTKQQASKIEHTNIKWVRERERVKWVEWVRHNRKTAEKSEGISERRTRATQIENSFIEEIVIFFLLKLCVYDEIKQQQQ